MEATLRGRRVGSWGDVGAFSFYATKNITTGEGGMLVTSKAELAERVEVLRLHGISRDAWKRNGLTGYQHWETLSAGFKYNMSDIQAALGLAQLPKLETFRDRRRAITKAYDDAFASIPEIGRLEVKDDVRSSYHLYVVLLRTERLSRTRDEILDALQLEKYRCRGPLSWAAPASLLPRSVRLQAQPVPRRRVRVGSGALPAALSRHGRQGGRRHDRGGPQGCPSIPFQRPSATRALTGLFAQPVSIGRDGSAAHSESDAS